MKLIPYLLGVLSPLSFRMLVWRKGEFVGTDQIGNRYYRGKPRKGYRHDQRWVVYNAAPEASTVPPEWHGWLHHQADSVPTDSGASYRKIWQLPWRPNVTGTELAYRPPGHPMSGGRRAKATGDYEPWRPEGATHQKSGPEGATHQQNGPDGPANQHSRT